MLNLLQLQSSLVLDQQARSAALPGCSFFGPRDSWPISFPHAIKLVNSKVHSCMSCDVVLDASKEAHERGEMSV